MALFDLKKLKENVSKSTEGIRKTITDVSEMMPEQTKRVNVADSMKDAAAIGHSAFESIRAKGEEVLAAQKEKTANTQNAVKDALNNQKGSEAFFSIHDALHIMYCLMAVDGTISEEEEDKFDEIGKAFDPDFASYKDSLIDECRNVVKFETSYGHAFVPQSAEAEENYYDQIHDYVGDLITAESFNNRDGLRAKILLWNLLTIAQSEGDYSENEKRLIRYFARKSGINNAVLLEMENTISTLMAIEKEEEWIKSTDRTYRVIEERVNELADRKNTIMQGVNALIAD